MRLIVFILPLLFSMTTFADNRWKFYSSLDAFSHSDANVHEDDWPTLGPYKPGEISYLFASAEMGVSHRNWTFGIVSRYDYYTSFNKESGELLYLKGNSLQPEYGRTYDIDLDVNHIRAQGLKLGYSWQPLEKWRNITARVAGYYLKANRLLDGRLKGDVTQLSRNEYEGFLVFDYEGSQDVVFDGLESEHSGDGKGVSIDIGFDWTISDKGFVSVDFKDIFSQIRWDSVRHSDFTANPRENEIIDGELFTFPSVYGVKKGDADYKQRLTRRINLEGRYLLYRHFHLLADIKYTEDVTLPRLGFSFSFTPTSSLDLYYGEKTEAVEIAFKSEYFHFSILADNELEDDVAVDKLLTAGLKLGFTIPIY